LEPLSFFKRNYSRWLSVVVFIACLFNLGSSTHQQKLVHDKIGAQRAPILTFSRTR
jgi:hypothetical protein